MYHPYEVRELMKGLFTDTLGGFRFNNRVRLLQTKSYYAGIEELGCIPKKARVSESKRRSMKRFSGTRRTHEKSLHEHDHYTLRLGADLGIGVHMCGACTNEKYGTPPNFPW